MDLSDSIWIPILAENGFEFHHTDNAKEVTMIKWIAKDELSQVREYSQMTSWKFQMFLTPPPPSITCFTQSQTPDLRDIIHNLQMFPNEIGGGGVERF